MTTAGPSAPSTRTIGLAGPGMTLAGAALVLLSYQAPWYGGGAGPYSGSASAAKIGDLRWVATNFGVPEVSRVYFGWLAWALLLSLALVGLAAGVASGATRALRGLGLVLGLVGAVLTYVALSKILPSLHDLSPYHGASRQIGLYLAIGGYLVAGVGAAIGPSGPHAGLVAGRAGLLRATGVLLGAAMVWLALGRLSWYDTRFLTDEPDSYRFAELQTHADSHGPNGQAAIPHAYFGWLAWNLLLAVLVLGLATAVARQPVRALRGAALVAGLAGTVLTYVAVAQLFDDVNYDGLTVFSHTRPGLWLALGGFLLAGVAAVIGPVPIRRSVTGPGYAS